MPAATMNLVANVTGQNSAGTGNALATNSISSSLSKSLATGTGSNQVADLLVQSGTVASGTPVNLDLVSGLAPPVGSAPASTKIVFIRVINKTLTPGSTLQIGGGTNPVSTIMGGTTPILNVGPGGHVDLFNPVDGFGLTAGTADVLRLAASTGNIDYEVIIGVR